MDKQSPKEMPKVMGKLGEDVAVHFLVKNGYVILQRNFYSSFGEIDIIAGKDDFVVFVEVKYRSSKLYNAPSEAVNVRKRKKIKKTALHYIGENEITNKDFRFDIIEITGYYELKVNHIENAFY